MLPLKSLKRATRYFRSPPPLPSEKEELLQPVDGVYRACSLTNGKFAPRHGENLVRCRHSVVVFGYEQPSPLIHRGIGELPVRTRAFPPLPLEFIARLLTAPVDESRDFVRSVVDDLYST